MRLTLTAGCLSVDIAWCEHDEPEPEPREVTLVADTAIAPEPPYVPADDRHRLGFR